MRIKLRFNLENLVLPIQYRKFILSFFKFSLSNYNFEKYEKLYKEKDNIIKPYTFSAFLGNAKFQKEQIILSNKEIKLDMAILDYNIGIILYNAFNQQRNKKFPIDRNSITLTNIVLMPEKQILSDEIIIKFLSPLIVRDRNRETKKDYYYSYGHENFKDMLKINIREQLKITDLPSDIINSFDIEAIDPDVTVIKFYEKQIEGSIGTYKLKGDRLLLDTLYKMGISSKRSSGFGMFEII